VPSVVIILLGHFKYRAINKINKYSIKVILSLAKSADNTIGGIMSKRIAFILITGLFLSINAHSSMISFFVVETGLSDNAVNIRHSDVWENALMDVFFDAGHIVSNAPILRLERRPQGDILDIVGYDAMDARRSGIDFILIAILNYTSESQIPGEIHFFIYRVNSNEKILERQIPGKTYRNTREEYDDIKAIVRGFVPYFN